MMIAEVGDGPYNFIKFLHILLVVVAFGATFTLPFIDSRLGNEFDSSRARYSLAASDLTRIVIVPLVVVAGVTGIGLIMWSDDAWQFSDSWISASFLVWLLGLVNGVLFSVPLLKQRATIAAQLAGGSGDPAQVSKLRKRIGMHTGIGHLLFVILLALMIWKPGA